MKKWIIKKLRNLNDLYNEYGWDIRGNNAFDNINVMKKIERKYSFWHFILFIITIREDINLNDFHLSSSFDYSRYDKYLSNQNE